MLAAHALSLSDIPFMARSRTGMVTQIKRLELTWVCPGWVGGQSVSLPISATHPHGLRATREPLRPLAQQAPGQAAGASPGNQNSTRARLDQTKGCRLLSFFPDLAQLARSPKPSLRTVPWSPITSFGSKTELHGVTRTTGSDELRWCQTPKRSECCQLWVEMRRKPT